MRALLLRKGERRKWIGGRKGEGRGEEGICRTNVKVLPTPLYHDTHVRVQKQVLYSSFVVAGESDKYQLTVGGYDSSASTAGDELSDANGMQFSTKDRDNDDDDRHCARDKKGGFWYRKCSDDYRLTAERNDFKWGMRRLRSAKMYVVCA